MDVFNLVLSHFIGDFILQSHWIAERKTKQFWICVLHVVLYAIPFAILVSANWKFLLLVAGTHLIIDYFRVAELVSYTKNVLLNPNIWLYNSIEHTRYHKDNVKFGYPSDVPEYIAFWLMIIVDQILHVSSNAIIYKGVL